ncbi:beta-ketoadipyl CoA thiolase [Vibrio neptunius]|uniref:3-oxoadipyl-CoA thiolase n=1 Tax=Vibrio neptunius TaxID=170651 RepID=UPI0005FA1506|nr:3-oxoadipyl-CoA thiolase [Vibrio neptunius]KJY91468.1 beta-ketoadipyl CoA thiolase [Vibrio neptunius]
MSNAYLCDFIRTPIGRYAGALSSIRADDLAAIPLKALTERHTTVDWHRVDDVILGCANQAGEDNRNVARMSLLLAGLDTEVPGSTVNRLCASGMEAVSTAARAIKSGEANLIIAGGVESMSRAPYVMGKTDAPFARNAELYDTTMGWRFINAKLEAQYGACTMPETAENLAIKFGISRHEQDLFARSSQTKYAAAQERGFFCNEIVPIEVQRRRQDPLVVDTDEHPRLSTLETLAKLKPVVQAHGTVTAGNASGINDGAAALLIASESALSEHQLTPKARIVATACAGVEPSIMGFGPAPAIKKVLELTQLSLDQMDVIELNEAFASQVISVVKHLGISPDDPRLNPNGGAIALGHPLGMSGARVIGTAMNQLASQKGRYALCSLCIGVGQGMAMIIERI